MMTNPCASRPSPLRRPSKFFHFSPRGSPPGSARLSRDTSSMCHAGAARDSSRGRPTPAEHLRQARRASWIRGIHRARTTESIPPGGGGSARRRRRARRRAGPVSSASTRAGARSSRAWRRGEESGEGEGEEEPKRASMSARSMVFLRTGADRRRPRARPRVARGGPIHPNNGFKSFFDARPAPRSRCR